MTKARTWEETHSKILEYLSLYPDGVLEEFFEYAKIARTTYYKLRPKDYVWPGKLFGKNRYTSRKKPKPKLTTVNVDPIKQDIKQDSKPAPANKKGKVAVVIGDAETVTSILGDFLS